MKTMIPSIVKLRRAGSHGRRLLRVAATSVAIALTGVARADGGPAHSLTVGEGFREPLGFHDPTPTFSWKLPNDAKRQTAYRLETIADGVKWDSGWIETDQSSLLPYSGPPFDSRQQVAWRVQYRDETGQARDWSAPAHFELGLLSAAEWNAKWIRPSTPSDPMQEPVAWLRRKFAVNGDVTQARLYVTARGLFELELNGSRVSSDHFANGWTSYNKRLDTLTYDVTSQLQSGENVLQAMLGKGWYAGKIGWSKTIGNYGHDPELLLQLEIKYADGTSTTLVSDDQWQATWDGPVISSSIYDGETYDARKPVSNWGPVHVSDDLGSARLTPKPFPPVRVTETLKTRGITEPEADRFVFDLGQNMVGWARVRIPVEIDQTATIRFAEMLNKDGTLYTANYRNAKSTDTYTAAVSGEIEWEPKFTFHGFRYVELSGLPAGVRPRPDWVTGVVLHSDLRRIGEFASSHAKLNQLQSNIVWGQRGNFLDIPTDCPQRDERMGWTGDAQVFCPTSMFNYDCHAFWKSWLASMRDDQMPDGRIPHVIPDAIGDGGSPGWMDAATIVPWEVYVRTGDIEVLAENFAMMEKLVDWYRAQSRDGLITEIKAFGDWLQPYAPSNTGDTPGPLLATAFYAHNAELVANCARVLGQDDKHQRYAAEAAAVKQAFAEHYFDEQGNLQNAPETQTAYLLAVTFDLIPAQMKQPCIANLVRLVGKADGHLRTGFLGTPYIVTTLDRWHHPQLACDLLLQDSYPSWIYSINQGATTMWERWNSYSRDDGFGDAQMNSFNHYAYGAIGQWMYERMAGLAPDPAQPGYKHFFVRPLIDERLDFARAKLETPYGTAISGWTTSGGQTVVEVVVPPNTTATLVLPDGRPRETIAPGAHRFELR